MPCKVVQTETALYFARLVSKKVDDLEPIHKAKTVETTTSRLSLVSADFHTSDLALHEPDLSRLTRHPDTDKLCTCLSKPDCGVVLQVSEALLHGR